MTYVAIGLTFVCSHNTVDIQLVGEFKAVATRVSRLRIGNV